MSSVLNILKRDKYRDNSSVLASRNYSTIEAMADGSDGICGAVLKRSSPYSFTQVVLRELLDFARNTPSQERNDVPLRALVSKRKGVFSLGGDLVFFRNCIRSCDEQALREYAYLAVDLIWESITASGREGMASVCLVQGEAQGGGFEAALAGHVLIAERGSWFGFPEGLFGLFPGMGARALLTARGAANHAGKIIASSRRYSAEELYEIGIVDFLANPGCGDDVLRSLVELASNGHIADLRGRFSNIKKDELLDTVSEWVEVAMKLSDKHLRTIDFLVQAQERARSKVPSIRVV